MAHASATGIENGIQLDTALMTSAGLGLGYLVA